MNCSYCYEREKVHDYISIETTTDILNKIYKIDPEPSSIEIFGGEPLLNWKAFLKILQFCESKNTLITTITNGLLLTKGKIDILKYYNVIVGISYDGQTTHDVYRRTKNNLVTEERVRKSILMSLKRDLKITVCMTFQNANAYFIENDIKQMFYNGVRRFKIYTVNKPPFAVSKDVRYSIYDSLLLFAECNNIALDINMEYSERKMDHYYYYNDNVKIQRINDLGNWDLVGWN